MPSTTEQNIKTKDASQLEKQAPPTFRKGSTDYHRFEIYKDVDAELWEDWHWQIKNRIYTKEQLSCFITLTPQEEEGIRRSDGRLAMAITPYWANLMDPVDVNCPIRKQGVPLAAEFKKYLHEMIDPCAEDRDSPVPGLVHRYPDRVLFIATEQCAMYCRHCTRRRLVGNKSVSVYTKRIDAAVEYIKSNKKIRDCLISGGDPFMLEDNQLEEILKKFSSLDNIEFLRLGTRVPVTMPMRITDNLIALLKKYKPLWISIHFNHPKEITARTQKAINLLADSGIPLGSQTVLLKGINDRPFIMKKLMHKLLTLRVRPYYIYQCDPAKGTTHFRTPIAAGISIIEKLRGHTSGYAVPIYVIDAPGGGGKIPLGPNYLISQSKGKYVLRNFRGKIYKYIE
ncbi:MAG: KamA family radical SAM protein [Candidatus Omnitrophica bacterium]|nr:KamA family radical SAM protein [Candidatus Omnitrophota bacterium]